MLVEDEIVQDHEMYASVSKANIPRRALSELAM